MLSPWVPKCRGQRALRGHRGGSWQTGEQKKVGQRKSEPKAAGGEQVREKPAYSLAADSRRFPVEGAGGVRSLPESHLPLAVRPRPWEPVFSRVQVRGCAATQGRASVPALPSPSLRFSLTEAVSACQVECRPGVQGWLAPRWLARRPFPDSVVPRSEGCWNKPAWARQGALTLESPCSPWRNLLGS